MTKCFNRAFTASDSSECGNHYFKNESGILDSNVDIYQQKQTKRLRVLFAFSVERLER